MNNNLIQTLNGVTFIGCSQRSVGTTYADPEEECWQIVSRQINSTFSNQKNLLISMTWFGPQFDNFAGWQGLMSLINAKQVFDNVFFLATVDPPYLSPFDLQWVKNSVHALRAFYLGNFDGHHQFNIFSIHLADKFRKYTDDEILLTDIKNIFVNYNRKPKIHRVEFVKKLIDTDLIKSGVVTLGRDETNDLYLTIGEKQEDYIGTTRNDFGIPMDHYTLHRLDIWKTTFLYINASTEFDPVNDLFCQTDVFKPILGLRPFVFNGVQRTYRWLRVNGFKTFNHYWSHIPIETGDVHDSLLDLLRYLNETSRSELLSMYNDMLPDLYHNKERFYEFSKEQKNKLDNLFAEN